eukprot:jgi/Mesen1/10357/ME000080S09752
MSSQAMYCLTKCIRADPHDLDAKWERALLLAEMGDHKRAAESLEAVHAHRAADGELCKMLARVYHKTGQRERAVLVLQDLLRDHPAEADLTAVNILAELHMEGGSFLDAIGLIEQARVTYCAGGDDAALPVDLSVKLGICHAYLGTADRAEVSCPICPALPCPALPPPHPAHPIDPALPRPAAHLVGVSACLRGRGVKPFFLDFSCW